MNEDQKKVYLAWLRDAHAMEKGLVTTLEKQITETEDKPDIQSKLKEHLEETKSHAAKIEGCLKRLGSDTSGGKDVLAQMANAAKGMMASMPNDSLVKNAMADYSAEHFEIASYTAIIAAAEALDDNETASICSDILEDEIDMANWIAEQLPEIVKEHVGSMEMATA